MHRRTSRLNHVLLTLIGLVLLVAGAFLLARHFGLISQLSESDRLYSRPERQWLRSHDWVFWVAGGVLVVVALIALRWLLVQPRIDRLKRWPLDPDSGQAGVTTLDADAATDQIEDDLTDHNGVARARVLFVGKTRAPVLLLRVAVHAAGDVAAVRDHVVEHVLPDARTALEVDVLPAQLHLLVAGKTEQRVVE